MKCFGSASRSKYKYCLCCSGLVHLSSSPLSFFLGTCNVTIESAVSDGDAEVEVETMDVDENFQRNVSLPQTPEQEKYLKHHFETLTDPPAEGNALMQINHED